MTGRAKNLHRIPTHERETDRGLNLLWLLLLLLMEITDLSTRLRVIPQAPAPLSLCANVITFRVGAIHHEGGDRRKDCFSNLVVTNNAALACTFHHHRARQRS
jgi:hypothetical protein